MRRPGFFRKRPAVTNEDLAGIQRALHESKAQRAILEQALLEVRQGIVVISADEAIAFTNPASDQLIRPGPTLSRLAPHSLQSLVRKAREQGATFEHELEIGHPARIVVATASPLNDQRVLLVLNDVTEIRRVEAVRRDFVAAASHELKTPIAAVLASVEALQLALERDSAAAESFATQIETSARQLGRLVSDLLDLSRLEGQPTSQDEVRLDELVKEELASMSDRAQAGGIELASQTVPVGVSGSRSDLGLALRNLLDNAVRHTPRGGKVQVEVAADGQRVTLDVIDTGEGISSRDLPRVFERFYRVDSARARATGGTGLGLAIVRHVVESHGGTIGASSVLGEGSTFSIRLRLHPGSDSGSGAHEI